MYCFYILRKRKCIAITFFCFYILNRDSERGEEKCWSFHYTFRLISIQLSVNTLVLNSLNKYTYTHKKSKFIGS